MRKETARQRQKSKSERWWRNELENCRKIEHIHAKFRATANGQITWLSRILLSELNTNRYMVTSANANGDATSAKRCNRALRCANSKSAMQCETCGWLSRNCGRR
jgi:hypothetical protein